MSDLARTATDALSTTETVVTDGEWEYLLPFTIGNSPVVSQLEYVDQ